MAAAPIDAGTKDWFTRKFGAVDDETVARLVAAARLYNLSHEDIYINWESFVVTREHGDMEVSVASVAQFEQYLQQQAAAAHQRKTPAVKKVRDLAGARRAPMRDFSSSPGGALPSTPPLKRRRPEPASGPASEPASDPRSSPTKAHVPLSPPRAGLLTEANAVVETLNPHVSVGGACASAARVERHYEPAKFRFRTMAMKLLESADVLDEQIDAVSQQLLEMHRGTDFQLGNPCMSSQFDVVCCGRVVPDSPLYDPLQAQALNDKSLFLETSRLGGIGQRIPLDVAALAEYSFFPGQVVALRGRNPTGRTFVVHEVIRTPELGVPVSPKDELQQYRDPTRVLVAAGPFSNQHTLDFAKLEALVELLNTEIRPQVAVFFGPFLDITNRAVETGDIELPGVALAQQPRTLDELFRLTVTPILKQINRDIQVVVVPSLRDAASKHALYPQAPLDRKRLGLPKNVQCYANPSAFSVNEAVFGASNMDVFKDLRDVYKHAPGGQIAENRFDRIANHVFQQKRYYPVFPGSVRKAPISREEAERLAALKDGVAGEGVAEIAVGGSSLEVPYMGLAELGDSLPDVLLVPSEMKYFAKVVRGVVVVNPGQFIRAGKDAARQEGSYAVLNIRPADDTEADNIEQVEGSELFYHNIYKRCRVDIHKS